MRTIRLVAALGLNILLAACVPFAARVEVRDSSPEELVAKVRQAARDEEWGQIYDRLTDHAQDGVVSRIAFVIKFPTERAPAPHNYKLADVVAKGSFDGALVDPANENRAIVFYSYKEPGKPTLEAKVLILKEHGTWRIEGPLE